MQSIGLFTFTYRSSSERLWSNQRSQRTRDLTENRRSMKQLLGECDVTDSPRVAPNREVWTDLTCITYQADARQSDRENGDESEDQTVRPDVSAIARMIDPDPQRLQTAPRSRCQCKRGKGQVRDEVEHAMSVPVSIAVNCYWKLN